MRLGYPLFHAVGVHHPGATIDWDLTPEDTFGTFESWGGRERLRNNGERFYYFYIDGWAEPPTVCLMERGVKHARVLARIAAPPEMVRRALAGQGRKITLDRSYAIDAQLGRWLRDHLVEDFDPSLVTPVRPVAETDMTDADLAGTPAGQGAADTVRLEAGNQRLTEAAALELVRRYGFHDRLVNPAGSFANRLAARPGGLTVVDHRTGLEWQRRGHTEITSILGAQRYRDRMNREGFAGHRDWRLPSLAEAMSLVEPAANRFGYRVHSCFSTWQPYVFTSQARYPGGRWFVDFHNGNHFWASAFNPGGYVRLCRSSGAATDD